MSSDFLSAPSLDLSSFLAASPSLAAASVPSAGTSPSAPSAVASPSAGFSGSLITVGEATVAITKSRSVIVGTTFSFNLTDEIFILVPISVPARSTTISSGIFSAGHFSSTFLLTIFNTPPLFKDQCDIQIDQSLVRGLDYYTGIVFETVSKELGSQDAFLGGGRYDNLSNQLGGKDMHSIGFAIGVERIVQLINMDDLSQKIKVGFIVSEEQINKKTYKIANDLRLANNSISLNTFLSNGSIKSQLRKANKSGCSFAVIIGEQESKNNQVIWKDLREKGEQEILSVQELINQYINL